ncbi:ABC transporter substrate-binding protein [Paenibacillus sp. FSL R10-2782]|uniref:ABC transporter substrate-binding protein n=1 Tax=Paenibacillus sp. FSL R10-2782 TaxID=2954661 RepID=UPI0031597C47
MLKEEVIGIEEVGSPINVEKMLEVDPDLILVGSDESYDDLSKISPTVVLPWNVYDVREEIEKVGDIIGRQAEVRKWLNDFDAQA